MPLVPLLEHKNADFVLEMPENGGVRRLKAHKILDFVLGRSKQHGERVSVPAIKWLPGVVK